MKGGKGCDGAFDGYFFIIILLSLSLPFLVFKKFKVNTFFGVCSVCEWRRWEREREGCQRDLFS